jgi:hypothetical protein
MVSLRYHVVSLAAVLLALAAGVILGAGPLAQAVGTAAGTNPTASGAHTAADNSSLHQLQGAAAYDDAVTTAIAHKIVRGSLTGQRVVLVVLPGTPADMVTATAAMVRSAGGTASGQVLLTAAWTDPGHETVLAGITGQLAPPTTKTGDGTPASSAASALAASILTSKPAQIGQPSDPATALLAGLVQAGFLTENGDPGRAASMAVVLGPAAAQGGKAWVPLVEAVAAAASGSVVAAPQGSAAPQGLVGAIRGDQAARAAASTIDCADLSTGRIALILALARDHAGRHGQYGLGPGADAPLPTS